MKHFEAINPKAVEAEIRRRQWESEAEKARDRSFWVKPRFDLLDMILLVGAATCAIIAVIGIIAAING
jgi:hypothetical protein